MIINGRDDVTGEDEEFSVIGYASNYLDRPIKIIVFDENRVEIIWQFTVDF